MIAGVLLDCHFSDWWPDAIAGFAPSVRVQWVGGPESPALDAKDPEILLWIEDHNFILVTNNRRSMPGHPARHLAAGRHIPGIFVVQPKYSIRELAEELELIVGASLPNEFQDQIRFLPMRTLETELGTDSDPT